MLPAVPWLVHAVVAAVTSYGGYMYYDTNVKDLEGSFDIYKLKFNLNMNIYGQTEALNAIVNRLDAPMPFGAEAIVLFGGVGVGKSLALSLIRENYQPNKMVINLMQQQLEKIDENKGTLHSQISALQRIKKGYALITIDNADIESAKLWFFMKQLDELCQKLRVRAKVVIGAQLFHDRNSEGAKNLISNSFKSEAAYSNFILHTNKDACTYYSKCRTVFFKPIGINTLKMCIKASAKHLSSTDLTDKQMEYLIGQISDVGLDFVPGGCKTVQNYVALLQDTL